ncbi:MAG: hypothetical protein IVW55_12250 [Chloroflexi bacterium]|nr:hypothetical protein [Chloroflexota bacterium]
MNNNDTNDANNPDLPAHILVMAGMIWQAARREYLSAPHEENPKRRRQLATLRRLISNITDELEDELHARDVCSMDLVARMEVIGDVVDGIRLAVVPMSDSEEAMIASIVEHMRLLRLRPTDSLN